jgi:transcriptional regulator with XRE-family HTH domain
MTDESAPFGGYLKKLREDRGWLQDDVAARTGWHQTKVSRLENGIAQPRLEELEVIASVFGVPLVRLIQIRKTGKPRKRQGAA